MALDEPTATRDVEEEAWTRVVAEQVRTALGTLSAPQREALTLAYYGGYTQREVAALTGMPLGTVKTRMLAGMRRLKTELGDVAGSGQAGRAPGGPPHGRGRPMSGDPGGIPTTTGFEELAVGWALHALEPEDEAFFAVHLAGCARCAETVAETTEVMGAMARDLPPAEPSEGLRSRLLAAVETAEQVPGPAVAPARVPAGSAPRSRREPVRRAPVQAEPRPLWRRSLPPRWWPRPSRRLRARPVERLPRVVERAPPGRPRPRRRRSWTRLLQPGPAAIAPLQAEGRTVATVVARADQMQVVTSGLAVNEAASSTYVVWGMGEGVPAPSGRSACKRSDGPPTRRLRADRPRRLREYRVSIEPGQQAPSIPTGSSQPGR